jgi:hypothetical protein
VLYSRNEEGEADKELGRLENCISVTETGDPAFYTVAFDEETGRYTATRIRQGVSSGNFILEQWYDKDGTWESNTLIGLPSAYTTFPIDKSLSDGDTFGLRVITSCVLKDGVLEITMTPVSKMTYPICESHQWELRKVALETQLAENQAVVGTYTCTVCGGSMQKKDSDLLGYLPEASLDAVLTRLDTVKLLAEFPGFDVTPQEESAYTDCANLTDVEKGIIAAAVEKNILHGTSDTAFSPENTVTRAQFANLLWGVLMSMKDCSTAAGSEMFSDVAEGSTYYRSIKTLYNLGIISGTSDNEFSPDQIIKMGDALTWLLNAQDWAQTNQAQ